jgi:hypothetical protein
VLVLVLVLVLMFPKCLRGLEDEQTTQAQGGRRRRLSQFALRTKPTRSPACCTLVVEGGIPGAWVPGQGAARALVRGEA